MIDSHIHLSHRNFDQTFSYIALEGERFVVHEGDRDDLVVEMKKQGINCCIEPAVDVDSNELLLKLSMASKDFVLPAVGNHPTRCIKALMKDFIRVRKYAKQKGVIAIGETGLDYHLRRCDQHRLKQKIWFCWQIGLADELGLPLILHIRMANEDAIKILRRNKRKLHGGVYHCFCGGSEVAKTYTEEFGLCLGIGGMLLTKNKNSELLKHAVIETPIEYLILETDGPYIKPERPKNITKKEWERARNTSLILPLVARKIADYKGIALEDVLKITEENTKRVLNLI